VVPPGRRGGELVNSSELMDANGEADGAALFSSGGLRRGASHGSSPKIGEPALKILQVAELSKADLIVLGSEAGFTALLE